MTANGGENEGGVETVNSSPRMGMTSSNASVDRIAVLATDIGSEESGRSKRKRVP